MENIFKMDGEDEYRKGLEQLISNEQYNLRKALCYFCEAAEKQHVEAMFQAGCLYLFGEPQIARNVLKATEYIKCQQMQAYLLRKTIWLYATYWESW